MGWYFEHRTKEALINEITGDAACLRHSLRGSTLWTVHQGRDGRRFIGCFRLIREGGLWGYKPMDETMGPCFYDCPLSFLEFAPGPLEGYSATWREKVRAYHADQRSRRVSC